MGHLPARDSEGEPFTFLDLGCATGFSLVMLAALYPEGHFYGVDFHPDHVAHAHAHDLVRRAGLKNVAIIEADFLDLAGSDVSRPGLRVAVIKWWPTVFRPGSLRRFRAPFLPRRRHPCATVACSTAPTTPIRVGWLAAVLSSFWPLSYRLQSQVRWAIAFTNRQAF
ncbi:methyltransferase domain-containing protein [Cyanobium sp. Cruz-8H5]|nr:methyltransferase domain-containing protein [Cyanobium sp. Cruz-8H5]